MTTTLEFGRYLKIFLTGYVYDVLNGEHSVGSECIVIYVPFMLTDGGRFWVNFSSNIVHATCMHNIG
jgi:hypothetical protein